MKFILGTKEKMTQYFAENGTVIPVTVVNAGPVTVTQVKSADAKDGYNAYQVAFGEQKAGRVSKAQLGHTKTPFKVVREFRTDVIDSALTVGTVIDAGTFTAGDVVTVSGTSKGKGFQGVVKRYNFKGGPRTHGQKHSEREPGSIGGGLRTRVPKGMRMAGRMGGDRVTLKNLKIVAVDAANNQLLVSGAIPGRKGTLVEIIG